MSEESVLEMALDAAARGATLHPFGREGNYRPRALDGYGKAYLMWSWPEKGLMTTVTCSPGLIRALIHLWPLVGGKVDMPEPGERP